MLLTVITPQNKKSSFNKGQDDFPDLKSYNDYLEEVEDISTCFPTHIRNQLSSILNSPP